MGQTLNIYRHFYFIGIAGSGMSAIAQYLAEIGKQVSGSDRVFNTDESEEIFNKLTASSIRCFPQDGSGLDTSIDVVVVSTAIEPTVKEVQWALENNVQILKRSELLALITQTRKTIAIGGTSGKSTTAGMLYSILEHAGFEPGIITGAGLVQLMRNGKIGNAQAGNVQSWLIIEADESDGSIVLYHPEIGIVLNIDKDHKEVAELKEVFETFRSHTKQHFIVNKSNPVSAALSTNDAFDFSVNEEPAPIRPVDFSQSGWDIHFKIDDEVFTVHAPGKHNMENAAAAIACARAAGVSLSACKAGLEQYSGVYRRHQIIGNKNDVTVVDDFAHNPVKCAASIRACKELSGKVVAWFQPHGYGPTRFLKDDFIREISEALGSEDEIWMSEIYYAGGTAVKDISAADLIYGIRANGKKAYFVENRDAFPEAVKSHLTEGTVLLLMGARDPSLERFAQYVFEKI